jgi:hypothetical protein
MAEKQVAKVAEKKEEATEASTNAELNAAEQKTTAEKALEQIDKAAGAKEGGDPAISKSAEIRDEQEARIAKLEQENADLTRMLKLAMQGKPLPPSKRERPMGKYRLTASYWDGRIRHPAGEEIKFAEGQAPQSAKFLG